MKYIPNTQDGDYVGDEDLYDDVVAAPSSEPHERTENPENGNQADRSDGVDSNGSYSQMGNSFPSSYAGRRHQLYVGNLTWVSGSHLNHHSYKIVHCS